MYASKENAAKQIVCPPYIKPTLHSMNRRAHFHDYTSPGTYLLTLVTKDRCPLFGDLMLSPLPHIALSALGRAIESEELCKIPHFYPNIHVWRYCIMPDHLHLILNINEELPEGKHLGKVIAGFKIGCNRAYWQIIGNKGIPVFEENYNDRLLFDSSQLDRWKIYLKENPQRLALKRQNPRLFTAIRNLTVCGYECESVGNIFLLDLPDKMAVIVHRADTPETFAEKKRQWLSCGMRGGVLVSAAVADREKEVMREALDRGYRIIYLRDNGFPEIYKPSGERFYACAEGRLLEISPWPYHYQRQTITREQCLYLNAMAEAIAAKA